MSTPLEVRGAEDARLQEAAHWQQRLHDPTLSEEQLQAWLKWYNESDGNRKAFDEMRTLYRRLRNMPDEFRDKLRARAARLRARSRRRLAWALAACVALVTVPLGVWRFTQSLSAEVVYTASQHTHRTVELPDGSRLVLAADSVVAVNYTQMRRALDVRRGQAYFEVKHNAERPFVVQAGAVYVTALGTAFNVARDRDKVAVAVMQGIVDVARVREKDGATPSVPSAAAPGKPAEHLRVSVGQRVTVAFEEPAPAQPIDALAPEREWRDGRVQFTDARLSEVVALVNRYARNQLVIDDPRVADLTYSGTVLRDHIDEWTASLPSVFPVRVVPMEDGSMGLVTRPEAP